MARREPVPGGDRPRGVRSALRPQGPIPDACNVRGGGRRGLCHAAGHRAERPRGHRVQGRQRRGEHRQRRAAVPVRPGPDVGPHRAHLLWPPAVDHRIDDRRGDRHRTSEARRRGTRRLEGGDGDPRADRRLTADPVHRRQGSRIHQGDAAPHNAAIQREAKIAQAKATAHPPRPRRPPTPAGRVRPADRRHPSEVPRRDRHRTGRGGPGRTARPGTGPA